MAKLGEVCLLKAGKFVSANDISPEYNKGLYPCFGGNGIRGYVADYTHDGEFPLIGRQGALCGNVNLASGKFHATEHAVVVQPKIEMNVHWLYYALNAMNLGQYATGAAQPGLAVSKLETLSIEIPNISEQNKIAQTLYKVEQLVNFRKQQLAKLDELVKAQFANIFENDADFHTDYMENLSEFVTVGIANSATHAYAEHGIVMLRNQNIKENHLDDTELVYIEPKFADKYKSKKLEANDILVTRTGYPGIACVVPQKYAGSQTFTTLIIRLKKETSVSSCYICHYINSSHGKKYVSGTKVGVAQQNFGAKVLAKMPVIIPPINLQNDFAAFVERVDQQKQTIQQSLEKLELMKKALMQEYFG